MGNNNTKATMDLSTLQGNIIQFIHFYCFFNLKFFDVKLAKMMKTDMPVFFFVLKFIVST